MSEQQESVKKKTLKSSSRSFLFSTGLLWFGTYHINAQRGLTSLGMHTVSSEPSLLTDTKCDIHTVDEGLTKSGTARAIR